MLLIEKRIIILLGFIYKLNVKNNTNIYKITGKKVMCNKLFYFILSKFR